MSLSVLENRVEVSAFKFHPRQDVIAGAVNDAVEVGDAIAHEAFAQGFDDRDPAANTGFVIQIRAELAGGGKQFFAMRREQSLVGGDDRLAEFERRQNDCAGQSRASDQLNDYIDFWIVNDLLPTRRHERFRNWIRTRLIKGLNGNLSEFDFNADA